MVWLFLGVLATCTSAVPLFLHKPSVVDTHPMYFHRANASQSDAIHDVTWRCLCVCDRSSVRLARAEGQHGVFPSSEICKSETGNCVAKSCKETGTYRVDTWVYTQAAYHQDPSGVMSACQEDVNVIFRDEAADTGFWERKGVAGTLMADDARMQGECEMRHRYKLPRISAERCWAGHAICNHPQCLSEVNKLVEKGLTNCQAHQQASKNVDCISTEGQNGFDPQRLPKHICANRPRDQRSAKSATRQARLVSGAAFTAFLATWIVSSTEGP